MDAPIFLAKLRNLLQGMASGSLLYRKTGGAGMPEVQTLATLKTDLGLTGTNSGDQTSIVGITGTKAQFDTAVTDGNIMYIGDAPTAHTHTASEVTDFNSAARAQVEAELIAGANVTITPGSSGATRTLTIAASGGGSQILLYKAKTSATSGDPGDGYMLWNNASQVAATVLFIDHLTDSGIDIDPVLVAIKTDDEILVFDKDDSDNTQYWKVTSTPTFFDHGAGSYLSVPVSLTSSSGTGTTGYANNHPLALVWRQSPGVIDHGTLTGLGDDDHTQYHTNARGDARYPQLTTTITAGTGLSGGGDLSANRTLNLANTTVTPGSYTAADITVDAQGRITSAANGSGGGGVTQAEVIGLIIALG